MLCKHLCGYAEVSCFPGEKGIALFMDAFSEQEHLIFIGGICTERGEIVYVVIATC